MIIPITSPHRANAERLHELLLRPGGRGAGRGVRQLHLPGRRALRRRWTKIDPELAKSPFIFPTADYLATLCARASGRSARRGHRVQRHLGEGGGQLMARWFRGDRGSSGVRAASGDLRLTGVTKTFGDFVAVDDLDLHRPARLVLRAARSLRLRQDARRCGWSPGWNSRRAAGCCIGDADLTGTRAVRAAGQHRVPELRAVPAPERPRQRGLRACAAARCRTRTTQAERGADAGADGRPTAARKPGPALRRPAAARRAGPRAGQPARGAAARRAAGRPRPQAAPADAGRAQAASRPRSACTFIHVTHDQEEAMTMADTVAVMNAGRIEQLGSPAELYDLPRTVFVGELPRPVQPRPRPGRRRRLGRRAGARRRRRRDVGGQVRRSRHARAEGDVTFGVRPEKLHVHRRATSRDVPATARPARLGPGRSRRRRSPAWPPSTWCDLPAWRPGAVFEQNLDVEPVGPAAATRSG